jgi:two-component system, LytTR family, sensor kinase
MTKFEKSIDQRKPSTHIGFFLFSLLAVFFIIWFNSDIKGWNNYLGIFIIFFLQIEIFIFLGKTIFGGLDKQKELGEQVNIVPSPGLITRMVLSRFVLFIMACFISALILFIIYLHIDQLIKGGSLSGVLADFFKYRFVYWAKPMIIGLLLAGVILLVLLWQDALRREQKLREENLVFQNETLKNQVNPHFLFNSLNTLSSLVGTQPEIAERFISKLSSIYRYIIENSPKDKVALADELAFIKDYFDLHKIRDEEKIELIINITDADQFEILPVSLQVLIENAIKHNKATREEPLKISIYIEEQHIVVKNNLQKMATGIRSTGIGLKNLAKRAKLITGRHLVIEETSSYFLVKVPLIS